MTTIETHAEAAQGSAIESFVGGVAAWSVTTDHKRIGRIYLGFGLVGLLAVTVLSGLLGIERASDSQVFDSGALLQLLANPTPKTGDGFGSAVAISGTRVIVGAPGDDTGATDSGSAYVYDLASGPHCRCSH
jgi:hypothetical protein